jgi:hypothetical protein
LSLVSAHFEVSAVKQVPVLDLGLSRAIGVLWSREREHAELKEFIENSPGAIAGRNSSGRGQYSDADGGAMPVSR